MIVQDIILGVGSVSLAAALVPTLLSHSKPPLTTSLPTALWLFTFAVVYASLGLVFATCTTAATAVLWTIIALQVMFFRNTDTGLT